MQNLTLGSLVAQSGSFPIPAVGERGAVIFGKIVKWFSDMSALVATKFNTANVVNNLTTTAEGYALDARQGKALKDQVTSLNDALNGLETKIGIAGSISMYAQSSGALTLNFTPENSSSFTKYVRAVTFDESNTRVTWSNGTVQYLHYS